MKVFGDKLYRGGSQSRLESDVERSSYGDLLEAVEEHEPDKDHLKPAMGGDPVENEEGKIIIEVR
ncbi:MAG: hypothetical protein DRN54_01635 [Thaumarchaeota archaeon]|nr:MAG: hypothetical protein DRN54_01635 [Nitrososphaerota archaeon]